MTPLNLDTLRKRADFLRLNKGRRFSAAGLVLQAALTPSDLTPNGTAGGSQVRLGLTVTKKIGNAVVRNRVRRRLREAARAVFPVAGRAGYDYVLIARAGSRTRPVEALKTDIERALVAVHKPKTGRSR